jgi:hypothetical protein
MAIDVHIPKPEQASVSTYTPGCLARSLAEYSFKDIGPTGWSGQLHQPCRVPAAPEGGAASRASSASHAAYQRSEREGQPAEPAALAMPRTNGPRGRSGQQDQQR